MQTATVTASEEAEGAPQPESWASLPKGGGEEPAPVPPHRDTDTQHGAMLADQQRLSSG